MPENPRKHHVSSRAKTVANRRIGLSAKEIKFLFIYSNIAHHGVPLSVIDGASRNPSEGKGRTFESCWVRQKSNKISILRDAIGRIFSPYDLVQHRFNTRKKFCAADSTRRAEKLPPFFQFNRASSRNDIPERLA